MEKFSWTDRLKNEDVWQRVNPASYIMHIIKIRKDSRIGYILHRNWLVKHATEGKIAVMGTRGRRMKQLVDDLKERRGYCKLKDEELDRTVWRTGFGRDSGSVVRQSTGWWWRGTYAIIKCNRNISSYARSLLQTDHECDPIRDVEEERVTAGCGPILR